MRKLIVRLPGEKTPPVDPYEEAATSPRLLQRAFVRPSPYKARNRNERRGSRAKR